MSCKSILLIEDDRDVRENLQEALESEGHTVFTARHGADAILQLEQMASSPGLILLDLTMPVMDGGEFLTRLETKHPELRAKVPVVVLTASGEGGRYRNRIEDLLPKPVDLDHLLETIEKHCREA